MNNSIKFGACFLLGAGAGFAAGWLYFKKKYELKADEEIEEMRVYFKSKEDCAANLINKPTARDEARQLETSIEERIKDGPLDIGWKKPSEEPEDLPEYGKMFKNKELYRAPYVISPEEFYDEENYEKITLTYFGIDRILADDENCMVEDIESAVGNDWEDRIGEYVQSAVYVRNDERQCDYEILYVDARYVDE